MINFNFTLNEEDAENLAFILQDDVLRAQAQLLENIRPAKKAWLEKHIAYLKELNHKIISSSKKVP